jgi:hypothetical protein
MISRPSVLVISNREAAHLDRGYLQALDEHVQSRRLRSVSYIATGGGSTPGEAAKKLLALLREDRSEVVLVMALKDQVRDLEPVIRALEGRYLVFWEGDAWGQGKAVTQEKIAWWSASDVVFSVAGSPQTELLKNHGARRVLPTVHTYDQELFAYLEKGFSYGEPQVAVAMVASNFARFPRFRGLPGSKQRLLLAKRLRKHLGGDFRLAGTGWPSRWNVDRIPFEGQTEFVRYARVLANWDHFPDLNAYFSDRLPIAMLAGRPQVTTRHAGVPVGPEQGVYLASTVPEAIRMIEALSRDEPSATASGYCAHAWVRGRLSHRQAVRYMLSTVVKDIPPPDVEPWRSFLIEQGIDR